MLTASDPLPMLTIEQVATRLVTDRDGVSRLIASGELLAVNVARSRTAKRPTWRIRPEDLETFELSRRSVKPSSAARPRRTKRAATGRKWF